MVFFTRRTIDILFRANGPNFINTFLLLFHLTAEVKRCESLLLVMQLSKRQ
jgi:hypothetical protein